MESQEQSHLHNNFLATAVMNKYGQMSQFSTSHQSLEKRGRVSNN